MRAGKIAKCAYRGIMENIIQGGVGIGFLSPDDESLRKAPKSDSSVSEKAGGDFVAFMA
jgi:hypothetical protein